MPRFPHPIEESGVDETIGTPPIVQVDAQCGGIQPDESESESAPFPLTSRFPFRMMRATEDRRQAWEPHRPSTRPSSNRRRSSFTESPGRPTPRWRAGSDATRAACRTGSRRPAPRAAETRSRRPRRTAGSSVLASMHFSPFGATVEILDRFGLGDQPQIPPILHRAPVAQVAF